MKPNYNDCTMNLIASIEKHFGYDTMFESFKDIDELLKNKKHVYILLLDGLGEVIINKNLKENSFIRTHYYKSMNTLYPPTTACVTSAITSGKLPNESGYFGWHQYFKEYKRDIVLFKNTDYYTNEYLGYDLHLNKENFYDKYNDENTKSFTVFPKWSKEYGCKSFKKQLEKLIEISKMDEKTFTYCYYDEPDHTMHAKGCYHSKTRRIIKRIDKKLKWLSERLGNDSICFMIADHGLVDVSPIYLSDYPDVLDLLELNPSIESRTCTFKVKDKELFKELFNKYFKGFELYTKEEFLNSDYIYKTENNRIEEFLFDFVAVAIDKYNFELKREKGTLRAHHAGATYDEMMVPIVII